MGTPQNAIDPISAIGSAVGDAVDDFYDGLLEADRKLHPKEQKVPSFTLYIPERLGIQKQLDAKNDPRDRGKGQIMGGYVPPSVKSTDKVNLIFYMHGDKVRIVKQNYTIKDYWNLPAFPLREGLNSSQLPYILVAPTLGWDADTQFGNLGTKFDDHLDYVMLELYRLGPPEFAPKKPPQIGDIILAGHSGAFGPMTSILANTKRYKDHIREIWGFDVMYASLHRSLAAVSVPVYAYFVATSEKSHKLAAMKKPNVFVMEGVEFFMSKGKEHKRAVHHDLLMQKFWLDRLQRIGSNGTNSDDRKRMVDK